MSPVFNETVNIVEPDEGLIDGETYIFFLSGKSFILGIIKIKNT